MSGRGRGGGGGGRKPNVSYSAPAEPAFLKRLKEQLGYKPPPTLDDKRAKLRDAGADLSDDDDVPIVGADELAHAQIVQLKEADLDEGALAEHVAEEREKRERELIERGRITFAKPAAKRTAAAPTADKADGDAPAAKQARKEDEPAAKQDARLLSFADEEEERDEGDDEDDDR